MRWLRRVAGPLLLTALAAAEYFRDEEGLRLECLAAVRDGFTGKMAIHPAQVPVINEVFTPTADEVAGLREEA